MIATKCPGQDMRYWTADDVHEEKCFNCGELIEFFKTDIRLRCPNCKTRVANSRFDMGCAQWCAYAEQCLGPAARGLKKKSLREVLEGEVTRLTGNNSDEVIRIKKLISSAEEICLNKEIDILPVIAGIVIKSLIDLKLIDDYSQYLDRLNAEHAIPRQALKDIHLIMENILLRTAGNEKSELILEVLDSE